MNSTTLDESVTSVVSGKNVLKLERATHDTLMDANAYLTRYGWTGGGLGYKQTGIRKPILASRKIGFHGIGITRTSEQNDQWWLDLFNTGLKALNTSHRQTTTPSLSRSNRPYKSELYRYFVQGEGLRSTIGLSAVAITQIGKAPMEHASSSSPMKDLQVRQPTIASNRIRKRKNKDRQKDGLQRTKRDRKAENIPTSEP